MKRELLQVLLARGEKIAKETLAWAKEQAAGEDYADLASFLTKQTLLNSTKFTLNYIIKFATFQAFFQKY